MTCFGNRHSASDGRQPAAGFRRHPFCILHSAFCIAAFAVLTANADMALHFNGSTYISLNKKFPLGDSVSLSAWVRIDPGMTNNPPYNYAYGAGIVGQGYWGGTTGFGLFVSGGLTTPNDTSDDKVSVQVRKGDNPYLGLNYFDPTLFTAGEWHHYLLVRDKTGGMAYLYVDGALADSGNYSSTVSIYAASGSTPTKNFAFGKNMADVGGNFRGYIADVGLWDVALTAADAAALTMAPPDKIGTAPYAYWPLDEGTGSTVVNKVDGTVSPQASGTLLWEEDPTLHRFGALQASVAQTNSVWYATASLVTGSGEVSLHVVPPQGATNVVALSNGVATAPATFTCTIPGLAADTTYSVFASLTTGTTTVTTLPVTISTRTAAVPSAGATPPSAFTRHITFAVGDGKIPAGTTVAGLPVLVRLSTAIKDFSYADFALPNGGDLLFTDTEGNILPHEIDTWDESGTSFVWVRLPEASAGTRLLCHYGRAIDPGAATGGIWRDYGGVWHFGEASGAAIDATGNGFDGTPTGYHADALVATAGVIGKARYQPSFSFSTRAEGNRGYMAIPSLRTLRYGGTFTVSLWFKSVSGSWGGLQPHLFHKTDGWIGSLGYNSTRYMQLYGANTSKSFTAYTPDLSTAWGHVTLVYSNTTAYCYTNGHLSASGTITAAADTANHLAIGWEPRGAQGYSDLACRYDELRISGETPTPERVAAEYAAMADAAFLDCGAVDATAPAPYCSAPAVAPDGNGGFTATVSLLQGSGTVELLVVSPQGATNVVALSNGAASAPATFTVPLTGIATNTIYALATRATGDKSTSVTTGGSVFNGEVTVEKIADATPTSPGFFIVSRPELDGATNAPLTVAFTLSGTAVAGTHYKPIPASVTIPAGAVTATVEVATMRVATGATSLTLALSGGNCLVGDPSSATMSVTSVRDPAALVWDAGTSATELTEATNWAPALAPEAYDTLSFTGDGESAYRFTMTNDIAARSFAFANGTSPAVIDFGGHTFSNDTATTAGVFKQTGTGALTLLNGELDAYTFSFKTATLAMTNLLMHGNNGWRTTYLTFTRDGARYLFDNVTMDLCSSYYEKLTFKGWDYEIDARNLSVPDPGNCHPPLTFSGTNATIRLYGTNTVLRGYMVLSGRNVKVSVADGRFFKDGGDAYGTLSMSGVGNELTVSNTVGSACVSYDPSIAGARQCAIRVLKGGKYSFWRIDDGLTSTYSFEGTSNLVEVADGTLSLPTLRFGYVNGAGGDGGNTLAVRGDAPVVSFSNGFYVGNTNKLPTRLVFQPGETGFGGAAPIRQTGSGKYVRIAANTVFEVNAKAFTKARDHGLFTLPLISFLSNAQAEAAFDAEALETFNRSLVSRPRGGWLTLETSGNYRVLTWNCRKGGTVLMLR